MEDHPLIIRLYEPRDASAVANIYRPYVMETTISFELEPPDEGEIRRRFASLDEGGYPALVAEQDQRVIGYAYAGSFRGRPAYRGTVEHSLYVARGLRRSGVGRQLMNRLIASCRERGFKEMVGVIADSDDPGSVPFHQKVGFRIAGRLERVGVKFGRALGVTLVQRATEG